LHIITNGFRRVTMSRVVVALVFGMLAFVAGGGHAFAAPALQSTSDIIPSTWAFSDLTGGIAAIANLDLVKLTFFGLLALSVLVFVAMKIKRLVKAGH
jgi:hypothetical protein